MAATRPFALCLSVPSGLPEGMRIVEKTNWSGIGFVILRSQLKEFNQCPPVLGGRSTWRVCA